MPDRSFTSKQTDQPIGLMALIHELDLPVVEQLFDPRRKIIITREAPSGIIGKSQIALRYEPIDLTQAPMFVEHGFYMKP